MEARAQGTGDLSRQLQGGPTAVQRVVGQGERHHQGRRRGAGGVPAGASSPAQEASREHHVLHGGGRAGLHGLLLLPGRGPRRAVPQDEQAGLDARRDDGRLLDRGVHRAAVRRAAGDLRREVHQHALRAGRSDRRPGRADERLDHGLRVPPAGAGLPAVRDAVGAGHPHRR